MNNSGQSVHNMRMSSQPINVSVQHVVAEYMDCRQTAEVFCARLKDGGDSEQQAICRQIKLKLEEIHSSIFPSDGSFRNIFLAWRLIHRVGEDLILLMTHDELYAQGRKILHDLKTSSLPDIIKLDWLSKVEECVKRLDELCKTFPEKKSPVGDKKADLLSEEQVKIASLAEDCPEREIRCIAQMFRVVTNNINDYVDDRFWDIWSRKFISSLYAAALLVGLVVLMTVFYHSGHASLGFWTILLIGAIGGVSSGILSSDQDFLAKGHFWLSVLSYPLQRTVQGALAAFIMFAMIQSGFFISITPPIEQQACLPVCFDSYSCNGVKAGRSTPIAAPGTSDRQRKETGSSHVTNVPSSGQKSLTNNTGYAASTVTSQGDSSAKKSKQSTFDLEAPPGKQFYLYLIMLFLAGFTGDKLLKYISDKVTSRLFVEAEKTKEVK